MTHYDEFVKILVEACPECASKGIKPETELQSLGIDSLDIVQILMDAEEKYGIEFSNEELSSFVTVQDIVTAIDNKL